jgi:hypothetical protein
MLLGMAGKLLLLLLMMATQLMTAAVGLLEPLLPQSHCHRVLLDTQNVKQCCQASWTQK